MECDCERHQRPLSSCASGQSSVEYALVTVALLAIALGFGALYQAFSDGSVALIAVDSLTHRLPKGCLTLCSFERLRALLIRSASGQATVESAFLIPVVLLGMVLALQPGILLWNRLVMEGAAAQGCRVVETLEAGKAESARQYVERRLEAVPALDIFHAREWKIDIAGDASSERVSVRISHAVRPVPLVGAGFGVRRLS